MNEQPLPHKDPVWGFKADILLNMKADMTDPNSPYEQIPARRRGGEFYEICCIPFFVYDLALGDMVQIISQGGRNIVSDVVTPSGRHTFRVWFGESPSTTIREETTGVAEDLGCLHEWYSDNLLALDAADDATAAALANWLESKAEVNELDFETGRTQE